MHATLLGHDLCSVVKKKNKSPTSGLQVSDLYFAAKSKTAVTQKIADKRNLCMYYMHVCISIILKNWRR